MGSGATVGVAICCGVIMVSLGLSVSIAQIVIGNKHSDDGNQLCLSDDVNFGLAKWLLIEGIVGVSFWGLILLIGIGAGIGALACGSDGAAIGAMVGGIPALIAAIFAGIWNLAWFVVGIIIIAGSPDACKDQVKPVWDLTIASLVFMGLSVLATCGKAKASNSDN